MNVIINTIYARHACLEIGYVEPISIENDGTIWLGPDNNRQYLTEQQQAAVWARVEAMELAYLETHPA